MLQEIVIELFTASYCTVKSLILCVQEDFVSRFDTTTYHDEVRCWMLC